MTWKGALRIAQMSAARIGIDALPMLRTRLRALIREVEARRHAAE